MSRLSISAVLFWFFVFASFIFRLSFLRTTPAYFSHDEIHYVTEAQSVAIAGQDLTGTWRPWQLRPSNPLYAELPSSVMAISTALFSDPFWKARVMSVVLGVILPLVLGGIGWKLTGKRGVFYLTAVIGLLNPWLFQFSRLSFDVLYSLFFYSVGILALLTLRARWRLLSLVPLLLGFFQYQGLKLIFLPMLVVTVGYILWQDFEFPPKKNLWKELRKTFLPLLKKHLDLLAVLGICLIVFAWYVSVLSSQSAGQRVNDMIFFNENLLSSRVNEYRRVALATPLDKVFANKFVVIIQEFLIKYLEGLSPKQLFIQGESVRNPFAVWTRGIFHHIDIILVGVGALALILEKKWRKVGLLLLAFVLIAPLPVAINSIDTWIMFRGAWIVVAGIIIMGVGAWYGLTHVPRVITVIFIGVYLIGVASFGYEYFYRYPIYSTKGTAFAERVMANYIYRLPKDKQVYVLVDESMFVFESYLAYNKLITKENLPAIQDAMKNKTYRLGNVEFATDCLDMSKLNENTVIINNSNNVTCDGKPAKLDIPYAKHPSPIDNGVLFTMLNDPICSKFALQPYIHVTDRDILDVESLSDQVFCDRLFSKPVE